LGKKLAGLWKKDSMQIEVKGREIMSERLGEESQLANKLKSAGGSLKSCLSFLNHLTALQLPHLYLDLRAFCPMASI
jgi:AAA+ superfamily predicted ATPase